MIDHKDKEEKGELTGQVFSMEVDYDAPLSELVSKGCYNWVHTVFDCMVKSDLPIFETRNVGKQARKIYLVRGDKPLKTKEVLSLMEKYGLVPGGLEELFAVGEQLPGKQKEFPIVALNYTLRMTGSKIQGEDKSYGADQKVALAEADKEEKLMIRPFRVVLDKRGPARIVNFVDADIWEAGCRFVAYKEE